MFVTPPLYIVIGTCQPPSTVNLRFYQKFFAGSGCPLPRAARMCNDTSAALFYLMPANKKPPHRREPVRGTATEERAKLQAAVCKNGWARFMYCSQRFGDRYVNRYDRLSLLCTTSNSLTQSGLLCWPCALAPLPSWACSATTLNGELPRYLDSSNVTLIF